MWMDPKTFFWRNVFVNIRQWYRPTLYIWVSISIDTILNFDGNFDICTNETLSMNRLLDVFEYLKVIFTARNEFGAR